MEEPKTYLDWSAKRGQECWAEVPMLIESINKELLEKAVPKMSSALIKALYKSGAIPADALPNIETWKDNYRHDTVINADIKVPFTCTPEQYVYWSYANWAEEYTSRREWEAKSFWGYLKHWIRRKYETIRRG